MRGTLTIAVAQPQCVARDVAANALAHAALISAANARLVLFPELSLTGYELDAPVVEPDDERLAPVIAACAATDSIALVGAPMRAQDAANDGHSLDGGTTNIATLAVDASGAHVAYRKLWIAADESHRFSPGKRPAALSVDSWRLGLAICKDFSVKQHASDTAALGIDAYLAATVMLPEEAVEQEQRAVRRALDLKMCVAVASFAGPTGGGYARTAGGSGIWGPDGLLRARAGNDAGEFARAALS